MLWQQLDWRYFNLRASYIMLIYEFYAIQKDRLTQIFWLKALWNVQSGNAPLFSFSISLLARLFVYVQFSGRSQQTDDDLSSKEEKEREKKTRENVKRKNPNFGFIHSSFQVWGRKRRWRRWWWQSNVFFPPFPFRVRKRRRGKLILDYDWLKYIRVQIVASTPCNLPGRWRITYKEAFLAM